MGEANRKKIIRDRINQYNITDSMYMYNYRISSLVYIDQVCLLIEDVKDNNNVVHLTSEDESYDFEMEAIFDGLDLVEKIRYPGEPRIPTVGREIKDIDIKDDGNVHIIDSKYMYNYRISSIECFIKKPTLELMVDDLNKGKIIFISNNNYSSSSHAIHAGFDYVNRLF